LDNHLVYVGHELYYALGNEWVRHDPPHVKSV